MNHSDEIRQAVAGMTRAQANDALFTIELRCRAALEQIKSRPRSEWSPAEIAKRDMADDLLTAIVSRRAGG